MKVEYEPEKKLEDRLFNRLLDVYIRTGFIIAMVMLCYKVFSPFLSLMIWALVLAVTLYPLHQLIAAKLRGKDGLTAVIIVTFGILIIVAPTTMIGSSFGDSLYKIVADLKNNTLQMPEPSSKLTGLPLIGPQIDKLWTMAHDDLPDLIIKNQEKISSLTKTSLTVVAGLGGELLKFILSFIIAGIIMAYGKSGSKNAMAISRRIFGSQRGEEFAHLATATIRAVAQGVIGIACIQALAVGVVLIIIGLPWTGLISIIVLVLGIAQIPAGIITLPIIAYLWISGDYETIKAIFYTVMLFVASMADNVLKPIMLGRGTDAPMPVILLGALGGMATGGLLGMFIGAIILSLGYQIFMGWVADADTPEQTKTEAKPVEA